MGFQQSSPCLCTPFQQFMKISQKSDRQTVHWTTNFQLYLNKYIPWPFPTEYIDLNSYIYYHPLDTRQICSCFTLSSPKINGNIFFLMNMYIHVCIIHACGMNCTQTPTTLITYGQPCDTSCKHYTYRILYVKVYLNKLLASYNIFWHFKCSFKKLLPRLADLTASKRLGSSYQIEILLCFYSHLYCIYLYETFWSLVIMFSRSEILEIK